MSMADIKPFDPHNDPENVGPRWSRWLESFGYFADTKWLLVGEADGAANVRTQRRSALLHYAGPTVQEIFSTLPETGNSANYQAAVTALNTYFIPQANVPYARQKFAMIGQKDGETVGQFATRLRYASRDCGYGEDRDNQIRDAILSRVKSPYVRRRLFEAGHALTLAETLTTAQEAERVLEMEAGMSKMNFELKEEVRSVHGGKGKKQSQKSCQQFEKNKKQFCKRCGSSNHHHSDKQCPAKGQICRKCGFVGHYAKMCKTRKEKYKNENKEVPHNVTDSGNTVDLATGDFPFLVKEPILKINHECDEYFDGGIPVIIGGVRLNNVVIDSGAKSCYMSDQTWEYLKDQGVKCLSMQKLTPEERPAYAYMTSQRLNVIGKFEAEIKCPINEEKTITEFVVIKGQDKTLLGKKTCIDLNILRVGPPKNNEASQSVYQVENQEIKLAGKECSVKSKNLGMAEPKHWVSIETEFQDIMKGVGKLKDYQLKVHVNPEIKPIAQPVRRLPFNLWEKVESKLKDLLDLDIIEEVEKGTPTTWVSPLVVIPKPGGDIRMCVDMRRANTAIIRERHYIPTVEEVLYDMNGSKVFSKLDMKWGFHQIELEAGSREITTFGTHVGLYRYKRLMFGMASAPEMYQKVIRDLLSGIQGAVNIADDVIVHGKDVNEHDHRLRETLSRFQEQGLTLNGEKCTFRMNRITFFGHDLTEEGVHLNDEKISAVVNATKPKNKSELLSFLCLVQYSAKFLPDFSQTAQPLWKLTKKDATFSWQKEHTEAFLKLKKLITCREMLKYFSSEAKTRIIADAGRKRLVLY